MALLAELRGATRPAAARLALAAMVALGALSIANGEELFVSERLTKPKLFTSHIEGPAVNADGDLFVVNLNIPGAGDQGGRIGKIKKATTHPEPFTTLPNGGIGNGIRFDLQGRMYVADFKQHLIHVIEPGSMSAERYFPPSPNTTGQPAFNQPNDLAIARDGTLYASDPKRDGTGRIWKITRAPDGTVSGAVMTSTSPRQQGKTNGLDLSPDNTTLYVSESRVGNSHPAQIFSYRIDGLKLTDETRVMKFDQGDVDGLRVDTDGRIFFARPDAGEVAILVPPGSPGAAQKPVATLGRAPTNLTFGGADGRDVFVTQADKDKLFVERFRTNRPGREPCLQPGVPDCRPLP
jgi:sugar lactone lactonase YvrE